MEPFLYGIYSPEPLQHLMVELHPPNQKILEKKWNQFGPFKFWKWLTEWLVYKEMCIKYSILLQDFGVQKLSEWPEVQVEKVYPP